MSSPTPRELEQMTAFGETFFPGHLGLRITDFGDTWMEAEFDVAPHLMAPNGFLHAGAVLTLADSVAGYGCQRALPKGATSFTTVELKSNFVGTAREGTVSARGDLVHSGRTTQLWDAVVTHKDKDKRIALFRCTQLIVYPKS